MKFIERVLISKSTKDDARLGKFPSEFEGYRISYPKLPIRLLIFLIDLLVVAFLIIPLVSMVGRSMPDNEQLIKLKYKYEEYYQKYEGNQERILEALKDDQDIGNMNAIIKKVMIKQAIMHLVLFLGFIGYIMLCQKYLHRTIGQYLFKVRILHRVTYKPATFKQVVSRSFLSLLTVFTLLIGFLVAIFNPRHITLHDYLSNTVLVRISGRK